MKLLVGIDIGGTNTVCGVVDAQGTVLIKNKMSTKAHLGAEDTVRRLHAMIVGSVEQAGFSLHDMKAIGIGTPGLVDPTAGVSILASNLGWHNFPLAERMSALTGLPVFVDNDVRMYVLGESLRGSAQGFRHVLGITVGTGLAAALIQDGKLLYGGGYMAGELGHMTFDEIPYVCSCGNTGCLETVASATGIVRQATEQLRQGRTSMLANLAAASLTAKDVSLAFDSGDLLAIEIMNRTGRLLGQGLSYAVSLFSPEVVMIGGGVAQAGDRLINPLKAQLKKTILPQYWNRLSITTATLGDDAGVIGNALNALSKVAD